MYLLLQLLRVLSTLAIMQAMLMSDMTSSKMHRRFTKHLHQLVLVLVLLLIPAAILEVGATSRLKQRSRRDWLHLHRKISMLTITGMSPSPPPEQTIHNFKIIELFSPMVIPSMSLNQIMNLQHLQHTLVLIISTISKSMIQAAIYCLALIIQGTVALVRLMSMSVPIFLILILLLMEQLIRHYLRLVMVT